VIRAPGKVFADHNYMTVLGKQAVALSLKLKQLVIIPELVVSR
jgi:hypothetical protein